MENEIPPYLLNAGSNSFEHIRMKEAKLSFLDKTVLNAANAVKSVYLQADNAEKENAVQKIHPEIKFISLIFMVIVISVIDNISAQLIVTVFIFIFYCVARLKVFEVYRKIFFLAFVFGFIVVLPASLDIITPGEIVLNIISFKNPSDLWIYHIPQNIGITINGLHVVLMVFLRILNSVAMAMLVVFTTSFP
ncbi:MAG TPA: energy-coupling factor transporter transmembrane component T, partial [Bacteroidales bacterium]|nr:energy-coupling factor transporter transmembrane component T [Bacteroidales bacterium]